MGPRTTTRRIGLTRDEATPPLLRTVGNKQRVPASIDAPPLSSDEEDENDAEEVAHASKADGIKPHSPAEHTDSSDDERKSHASIKRTNFSTSKRAGSSGALVDTTGPKRRRVEEATSSQTAGDDGARAGDAVTSSQSDHFRDDIGFTRRRKSAVTYNKKEKSRSKKEPESKFRVPDKLDSPEKAKAKLLMPDLFPDSPSKGMPARFKPVDREDALEDPPSPTPEEKVSTQKGRVKSKNKANPLVDGRSSVRKGMRRAIGNDVQHTSQKPPSPRAVFVMPEDLPEVGGLDSGLDNESKLSPLIDDDSELESDDGVNLAKADEDSVLSLPACPWCGEPVEESLLNGFSRGKRLTVRMQTAFCQKHRKQTALKTWESKKYPTIAWQDLEGRLAKHRGLLLAIVKGKPSYFRLKLAEDIEAGKARSLKKEGNLNPGYYGPRGFNVMSDYLVAEFGDLLKQRAVDDRVIAGRGSAAFIQAVLVAELGVQLIREDMGVDDEEARTIMEESKVLGDMINEEI